MEKVIEIKNLKKYYKGIKAVDGVSLEVEKGKIIAILGPNGAGKTTTVETLEGLREATSGDIYYFGNKVNKISQEIKERIGVQLQSNAFFENLTVKEIIKAFGGLYEKSISVSTLLDRFKLIEKKNSKIKNLSGGQLQRVALAVSVVNDPDIVFLDEPTTGLDPQARRNLWEEIETLKKDGKTVILTTHYMEEAEKLADKIYIFDMGKVIAEGTMKSLIDSLNMSSVIEFETDSSEELKNIFNNLKSIDEKFEIETDKVEEDLIKLMETSKEKDILINNIFIRKPNLEDVFLHLTGRSLRE
ncbi:MAG: ABC transporter ATP-binding protein [Thermotogota bacterium]